MEAEDQTEGGQIGSHKGRHGDVNGRRAFLLQPTCHSLGLIGSTIIDQVRRTKELKVKEALHVLMTPSDQRLIQDKRLKLLGCWTAMMRQMKGE